MGLAENSQEKRGDCPALLKRSYADFLDFDAGGASSSGV